MSYLSDYLTRAARWRVTAESAAYPRESRIVRAHDEADAIEQARAGWPCFQARDARISAVCVEDELVRAS